MKYICVVGILVSVAVIGCTGSSKNEPQPTAIQHEEGSTEPTAIVVTQTTVSSTPMTTEPSTTIVPTQTDQPPVQEVAKLENSVPLPIGDPQRGEELNVSKACSGCHLIGAIGPGPSWIADIYAGGIGIGQRAEQRWQQSDYTGNATSGIEYLYESIIEPNAFVINGYSNGVMPQTYRDSLTDQEIADIIAFLLSIE